MMLALIALAVLLVLLFGGLAITVSELFLILLVVVIVLALAGGFYGRGHYW